jgi:AmiR/NasT family two-component response regulator
MCKIVAVTAYQSDEVTKKADEVGISEVVYKPVNMEMIKAILKKYY